MAEQIFLPPSNEGAEQALLGSLIVDPSILPVIAGIVKPADFFIVKHTWIFEAIVRIGLSVDLLTLTSLMRRVRSIQHRR